MFKAYILILLVAIYGQQTSGHLGLESIIKDNSKSTEGKNKQSGTILASTEGDVVSATPTEQPGKQQTSKRQEEEGDLEAVIRFFASAEKQAKKDSDKKNGSRSKRSSGLSIASTEKTPASPNKNQERAKEDDIEDVLIKIFGSTAVQTNESTVTQHPSTVAPTVVSREKAKKEDINDLLTQVFGPTAVQTNVSTVTQQPSSVAPTLSGDRAEEDDIDSLLMQVFGPTTVQTNVSTVTQQPSTVAPAVVSGGADDKRNDDLEKIIKQIFGNVSEAGQRGPVSEGVGGIIYPDSTTEPSETRKPLTIAPDVVVDPQLTRCIAQFGDEGACVPFYRCNRDEYDLTDIHGYEDPCDSDLSCCALVRIISNTTQ